MIITRGSICRRELEEEAIRRATRTEEEKAEEEKLLEKNASGYDFMAQHDEPNEATEVRIEVGKEYVTGFDLIEELDSNEFDLFRCKIDNEEHEIIMGVELDEDISRFVSRVVEVVTKHWKKSNEFKYPHYNSYEALHKAVEDLLTEQIRDYFMGKKNNPPPHRYRGEITFKTEKEGIVVTNSSIQRVG